MGQTWGYLVGVGIAGVSALSEFMFMPYYLFWSLAVIAIDAPVDPASRTEIANPSSYRPEAFGGAIWCASSARRRR